MINIRRCLGTTISARASRQGLPCAMSMKSLSCSRRKYASISLLTLNCLALSQPLGHYTLLDSCHLIGQLLIDALRRSHVRCPAPLRCVLIHFSRASWLHMLLHSAHALVVSFVVDVGWRGGGLGRSGRGMIASSRPWMKASSAVSCGVQSIRESTSALMCLRSVRNSISRSSSFRPMLRRCSRPAASLTVSRYSSARRSVPAVDVGSQFLDGPHYGQRLLVRRAVLLLRRRQR